MAKANAKNKSPSTALHPPYLEMIADAISTLKERTGSSQQAIAKFIEDKHKKVLPQNFRKLLSLQLKKFVKSEKLFKVKNSYKISSTQNHDETQKNKTATATNKTTPPPKQKGAKKIPEKKTKRLSQVKTPEALKNNTTTTTTTTNNNNSKKAKKKSVVVASSSAGKVKRLSQLKTPEGMKKPNLTPMKRKSTPKPINSSRPTRNARK